MLEIAGISATQMLQTALNEVKDAGLPFTAPLLPDGLNPGASIWDLP